MLQQRTNVIQDEPEEPSPAQEVPPKIRGVKRALQFDDEAEQDQPLITKRIKQDMIDESLPTVSGVFREIDYDSDKENSSYELNKSPDSPANSTLLDDKDPVACTSKAQNLKQKVKQSIHFNSVSIFLITSLFSISQAPPRAAPTVKSQLDKKTKSILKTSTPLRSVNRVSFGVKSALKITPSNLVVANPRSIGSQRFGNLSNVAQSEACPNRLTPAKKVIVRGRRYIPKILVPNSDSSDSDNTQNANTIDKVEESNVDEAEADLHNQAELDNTQKSSYDLFSTAQSFKFGNSDESDFEGFKRESSESADESMTDVNSEDNYCYHTAVEEQRSDSEEADALSKSDIHHELHYESVQSSDEEEESTNSKSPPTGEQDNSEAESDDDTVNTAELMHKIDSVLELDEYALLEEEVDVAPTQENIRDDHQRIDLLNISANEDSKTASKDSEESDVGRHPEIDKMFEDYEKESKLPFAVASTSSASPVLVGAARRKSYEKKTNVDAGMGWYMQPTSVFKVTEINPCPRSIDGKTFTEWFDEQIENGDIQISVQPLQQLEAQVSE